MSNRNQRLMPFWRSGKQVGQPKLCKLCPTPVHDSFDGCLFRLCQQHLREKYRIKRRIKSRRQRLATFPARFAKVMAPAKSLKSCPDRSKKQKPFEHLTPEQQELAWKIYEQYEHRYHNQGALIGFCTSAALAGGVRQRGLNARNRKRLRTFYLNYMLNGYRLLGQGKNKGLDNSPA